MARNPFPGKERTPLKTLMSNHSISQVIVPCQPPTGKRGFKNLTGIRFGRLVANKLAGKHFSPTGNWVYCWDCMCDCGTRTIVAVTNLTRSTRSCGCLGRDITSLRSGTHRMIHSPEYSVWGGMFTRCNNPNSDGYKDYGGRGIIVCERWGKFENFFEDMGKRPSASHTIERRDNNGNYEPGNCHWATPKDQARNRRNNRLISLNGKTMCISAWGEAVGMSSAAILRRLKDGWSEEEAITTPLIKPRT